jgi:excisionase family DNA binding protein
MSAPNLGAAILASLDEEAVRALAERLRPYLHGSDDRPLLTPAQAAERLSLHPKTVARMARDGRLPAVKVGAGWRFRPDQLDIAPPPAPAARSAMHRRRHLRGERASVRAIRGHEIERVA